MARPHSRFIADDRDVLQAIKELPDYKPIDTACTTAALVESEVALNTVDQRVASLIRALAQARIEQAAAAEDFHTRILQAKVQVIAQYGPDSAAVEAIGLKRKSARRKPVRRAQAAK